jgi:integrase/recombinase XerD
MFRRMTRDRYLSDDELEAFMAAVRGRRHKLQARNHALFALLSRTGIRPSEALALTGKNVHLYGKPPWIQVIRLKKKGTKTDDIELTPDLTEALRHHLKQSPAIHDERLFNITKRQARRLFHYYARLAGIVRRSRLYMLRHTAATRIYRATRDIKVVQALLGHESADTSAIYAHVSRDILGELAGSFPVVV